MQVIGQGDSGDEVRDVQHRLVALGYHIDPSEAEGVFGTATEAVVRGFQQRRGLLVDGRVGPETWAELVEAGYQVGDRVLYLRFPYFRGDDVRQLQQRLNSLGFDAGRADGIFGERCDRAVREFQRNMGFDSPDGIVGSDTVHALERVRRPDEPAQVSRAAVREAEALVRMRATLEGARLAIDPGHGPDDPGPIGTSGLSEADAAYAISEALAEELRSRGAEPLLLRGPNDTPDPADRAAEANRWGAEACISIHLNAHTDEQAEGAMCLYFGNELGHSPAGLALAECIQEELTTRLGLMDGRTNPMSITILRETTMPAVQVEPCFVTNPREERWLCEEAFRRDIAIAMAHGIERFFGERGSAAAPAEAGARGGTRAG